MALSDRDEVEILQDRWRALFDQSPVGMAELLADTTIVSLNGALGAELERPVDSLLGTHFADVVHPDDRPTLARALSASVDPGSAPTHPEIRLELAGGSYRWVEAHVAPLAGSADGGGPLLLTCIDVTTQRHYEAEVQQLIDHDPTTGLLSRTGFETTLRRTLQAGEASGAVVIVDIDRLREINETLGHQVGVETVAAVAATLRHRLRANDAVGRIGSERFAVLLTNVPADQAEAVAFDLVRDVRNQVAVRDGDRFVQVTASAGVVDFASTDRSPAQLLTDGELAVKDAKEAGGNGIRRAPSIEGGSPSTGAAQNSHSLDEDNFVLLSQPILDLQASVVDRYELLLRIRGEGGSLEAPGALLGFAERAGRVGRIDRWVVNKAIDIVGANSDRPNLKFEVNVSGRSIGDPHLMAYIEQRIKGSGIDPTRLIFEISEVSAVANIDFAREFSRQLTRIGCQFALDNFGSDLGGFYILKHLPFDYVKIDGEFVVGCLDNPTDQLLIEAIVRIAQGLGKKTVAQFVPDGPTLDYLKQLGVDYAQGYYVGEPKLSLRNAG